MRELLVAAILTMALISRAGAASEFCERIGFEKGTPDYARCVECTAGVPAPSDQAVKFCVITKRSMEESARRTLKANIRHMIAVACDGKPVGPDMPECLPTLASQMAIAACLMGQVNPDGPQCNQFRAKLHFWLRDLTTCYNADESEQHTKFCDETIGKSPPPPPLN
jgi:hypothetical protein